MSKLIDTLKPIIGAVLIIVILKLTGTLTYVSAFFNSALLKTGIMNASVHDTQVTEEFDFDFKIKTLEGEQIDFNQFKGKVIFLNLWATWCGPCRAEMPTIQKLYEDTDHKKIAFVILSLDNDEELPKVKSYIKKYDYTFPVYQPKGYLTEQLNVRSIPTTLIINKEGKIVSKEVGLTNFDTKKFKKYLATLAE